MALISIKRNVDLQPGLNAPAVFNCSQSDKGTTIMLGLMNGGNDYTVPSGVTITIRGSRSNGAVFTPVSATSSGSTVSFTLTEEMTDTAGPTLCEAVLEQGNNVLGTANFIINVEGSPMGADVPPVFTDAAWTWMLGKLTTETVPALGDDVISSIQGKVDKSQGSTNAKKFLRVNTSGNVSLASTDKTLLVADQIADAKETGDQIRALDAEIDGVATTLGGSISTLNGITTNLQSSKLNKNQGTSNAGKTMVVDSSGNIVPGDVPITIDDTLSIADAAADAKAAGDAIALKANASTIAPEFSDQNNYTAGSYVYKNGVLYKFTAAHSGAWTGTDAVVMTLGGEVTDLKADLNDVDQKINFGLTGIRSLAYRTSEFIPEYYIPNGAVGTTVDITNVTRWSTTSTKAAYCLFTVQKGDIVHAEGYSLAGSTNRFMVLLDSDKKVLWSSPTGASVRDITVTATADGYCLINAAHYSGNQYREHKAIQLYGDTYKPLEQDISVWNQYKSKGYVNIQGDWVQGEFGSFSDVLHAAKSPWMTLGYDTAFICTDPENYYLTFYINNNGTLSKNTSYPTWGVFRANTRIRVAVNAKDETQTLSPDNAKTKVLVNLPISENDRLTDTYSSVGVFDQIGIIGDSFAVGSMHWENDGYKGYPNLSWGKLMCKRNGNNCTLYAHGGYGIKRFVEYILPTVLTDEPCDLYWWGLGINDNETARTNASATGTITDITNHEIDGEYPDTLYGNFGKAVSQIKAHAPLAKHVFASCIKDNVNNRYTSYSAINTVLKTVAEHYGFPFIEITDDPFYWSAFYRDSAWVGHPVLIGYAGMSWANERLLNRCIVDNMAYFRDFGRTNNPDDTDPGGTL